LFSTGCTRHPFYHKKQNILLNLKKKIGIAQFDNRTKVITDASMEYFYQQIISDMETFNSSLQFLKTEGKTEILQKSTLLLSADHIDRQTLIKTARKKGYQAVIWGIVNDINVVSIKKGIPFFRKEKKHIRCRGEFSLFDCETSSKIWFSPINETYLFDNLFAPHLKKQPVLDDQTIKTVLSKLSKKIAQEMCEQLKMEPWKGFIIENNHNEYLISSGMQSGIVEHMTFDVIGSMGTLSGIYGQKYFVPGNPIGRIQIISVDEKTSKASSLYGNQLENSISIQYINHQ
jgi:hypothetical protein